MQLEFFFGKKKRERELEAQREEIRALVGYDENLTVACRELLAALEVADLAGMVTVVWNARMRSTAGRAFWPEMKIELNPKLREIAPAQVERTMRHELAHLLAFRRAGRRKIAAHGKEWKAACADLGIPGERATHSLPLPSRRQRRKWSYTCPECGAVIERVKRMRRSVACYPCCRRENGGTYCEKFLLLENKI